jgi:hypothetical protein
MPAAQSPHMAEILFIFLEKLIAERPAVTSASGSAAALL